MVDYVFMACTQTSRLANLLIPKREDAEVSSRLLATAARTVQKLIECGDGDMGIKELRKTSGFKIDLSALEEHEVA